MAVTVNRESIENKMRAEINKRLKDGRRDAVVGLEIITEAEMNAALQALIGMLQACAGSFPGSVASSFASLEASGISYSKDKTSATATISFGGDLGRPSLVGVSSDANGAAIGVGTGGGIDDIIMLFEIGYSASARVYGYWKSGDGLSSGMIASRQSRPGLGALQAAIDAFNGQYGSFAHASLG